jgi:hypothetical protein
MHETSGVLRPVVLKYLEEQPLTEDEVVTMRAYLRQWMAADFRGSSVGELRERLEEICSVDDLRAWLDDALDAGIDPL